MSGNTEFVAKNGLIVTPGTRMVVPVGNTGQRAASPQAGDLRYNTDNNTFEGYANGAWGLISGNSALPTDATFTGSVTVGNSTVNVYANSTVVTVGANAIVNSSTFYVGNSTVNAFLNSSTLQVGANVSLNSLGLGIGNSTVSVFVNSVIVQVGNTTVNNTVMSIGNSTVFATVNSTVFTGISLTANNASYLGGIAANQYAFANQVGGAVVPGGANTAVQFNSSGAFAGNSSTFSWNLNSNTLFVANAVNVGANVFLLTTGYSIGNSTANLIANSTKITLGNTSVNTSINATSFSGTANNALNLGGTAAASYLTSATAAATYLGIAATAADSSKLGGTSSSGYLTTSGTAADSSKLGGSLASAYQLNSTLSANVAKLSSNNSSFLGGVAAASYALHSDTVNITTTANVQGAYIIGTTDVIAGTSDARVKNVIGPIHGALDIVNNLNGVRYKLRDDIPGLPRVLGPQIGLLVQEVEPWIPEVVVPAPFDVGEDGKSISGMNYQTLKYDRIVAVLVEAIKELRAEVSELRSKVS